MNDRRTGIIASDRASLTGGKERSSVTREAIQERIQSARLQVQPSLTGDFLERYCEKHVAVHGTFDRLTGTTGIIDAVDHYLQNNSYLIF